MNPISKNNWITKLLPHIIAGIVLLLLAVIYCKPVLEGKKLGASDNLQWQAMAKESMDYKKVHGHTPLWTTGMFSGMPTYQIANENPYKLGSVIPAIITLGLPKPIDMFFLAAITFYLLGAVLGVRPWIGVIDAIAYAYASYSPIIISAGHDTKMIAMAWLPGVVAALLLILRRKYLLGTGLMALFLTYLIGANHLQVTYYTFLLIAIIGIAYAIHAILQKQIRDVLISAGCVLIVVAIALGNNAMPLWTTYEYAKASNRGGNSDLTPLPDPIAQQQPESKEQKRDYAFQWSYGKIETLTLLVPNIYGGSSSGHLDTESATYKQLTSINVPPQQAEQFVERLPLYWGDQSAEIGTSGPVYFGVVICLLAILALFIVQSWHKWWLAAVTVLFIFLAWGSNLPGFNYFLFDHFPFYSKLRAPSQALIIPQLTFAILAIMALQELVEQRIPKPELIKKLKWTGIIVGGALVLILLMSGSVSYTNATNNPAKPGGDDYFTEQITKTFQGNTELTNSFMNALREDRATLYRNDAIRSLIIAALAALLIWLFVKGTLNAKVLLGGLVVLVLFDLLQVDKRYLSDKDFIDDTSYSNVFQATPADQQIWQDKDPYYRVYDLTRGGAMGAYFHKSITGYHAAKLQIYQDLIERQISRNNLHVLNMLNAKYIIVPGADGQPVAQQNPQALGNAWFVKHIEWVSNADAEMKALDNINAKDTVVIQQLYKGDVKGTPVYDSSATIHLRSNELNTISYEYSAARPQFAVFSEIYYKDGWKAFVDGQQVPYAKVNYVLRGMMVPAGKHVIEFRFEPASYYTGNTITMITYSLMLLTLAATAVLAVIRRKKEVGMSNAK